MKKNLFFRFVTNNHRFKPGDSDYGKVYLVNIFLFSLFIVCFTYFIFNFFAHTNMELALFNAIGVALSITGIIYFHKTNGVKVIIGYSVLVLFISLFAYLSVSEQSHHSLYWLVVLPPVVFFLLGHKKARIVSFIYFILLVLFMALNYSTWEAQGFGTQSFLNIIGPTIVLIFMINFYERSRSEISTELEQRNLELAKTISDLSDNQEKFEILLASTEEGIFGVNLNGECVFCNKSGLEFLGYNVESELLGQNMHNKIHSKYKNEDPLDLKDSKIFKAFKDGKGIRVSDEVFWKKDGTFFDVEYAAYPQYKGDEIIGIVVSFMDITQEKKALERMQYLNCHDWLTGLHNRICFENALSEIDKPENLPLSIIFADINGLKLTNDIFGHASGDQLLIQGAEVLKANKREQDLLARLGGDEFALILPGTEIDEAIKIGKEIQKMFSADSGDGLPLSMAIGCATKVNENQPISQIIADAEGEMYKEKTLTRHSIHEDIVYTLINMLHTKSPREKVHSENVMKYSEIIATAVNLPKTELVQLKKMAYFHDIGKIVLEEDLIKSEGTYSNEQVSRIRQHPAIAYRILNLFDETLDIAGGVYAHHENWNGSGYPKGLKGEEIPYMARIISVAEVYDALTNKIGGNSFTMEEALEELIASSGTKLDPELVSAFCKFMKGSDFEISHKA